MCGCLLGGVNRGEGVVFVVCVVINRGKGRMRGGCWECWVVRKKKGEVEIGGRNELGKSNMESRGEKKEG